jgi:ActR/RegA family two-component response regulator
MRSVLPYANKRLLLVERDDAYRYVLTRQLRSSGFDVIDVRLALDGIFHLCRDPGLRLAVIDLPVHTRAGLVFAFMLLTRHPDGRVALMTTNADPADTPEAAAFGGALLKSPDMPAMAAGIQERLGFMAHRRRLGLAERLHGPIQGAGSDPHTA